MDEMTHFFQRKDFTVTHAEKQFFQQGKDVHYDLTYFWFQPEGAPYPPGLKFPLVLILHGTPGNTYAGKFLITQKMQLDFPAFIVAPVLQTGWTWANPLQIEGHPEISVKPHLVEALPGAVQLVASLAQQYPVDTSRIYVIGCSEGGTGAYGAVRDYADVFAAAVPISGVWGLRDAPKMTQTPMWAFHGALDSVLPADNASNLNAKIKQSGGNAIYTEFPDMGHDCPSPRLYSQVMWKWLFSQHK